MSLTPEQLTAANRTVELLTEASDALIAASVHASIASPWVPKVIDGAQQTVLNTRDQIVRLIARESGGQS